MTQVEPANERQAKYAANFAGALGSAACTFASGVLLADSRCGSSGHHHRYSGEAHQVTGSHGQSVVAYPGAGGFASIEQAPSTMCQR
jgi:hypothetical protein